MQLTKLSKLKIIHTPGKNLSVADILSRSFPKTELQINQLKHKQLPLFNITRCYTQARTLNQT